jgi:hypothetical protein
MDRQKLVSNVVAVARTAKLYAPMACKRSLRGVAGAAPERSTPSNLRHTLGLLLHKPG